jgi:hypothetical protein
MFCPHCNHENPDTNRFCSRCGCALSVGTTVPAPIFPPQTPVYEPVCHPQQSSLNPNAQPGIAQESLSDKQKYNRRLLIITAICTAIALIIGIAGWYFHFGPGA